MATPLLLNINCPFVPPIGPIGPVAPVAPVAPVRPVAPAAPVAPCKPISVATCFILTMTEGVAGLVGPVAAATANN